MAPASAEVRFNANTTNIAKGKSQINFASLSWRTDYTEIVSLGKK